MPDVGANGKVAPCLGLFTIAAFATSMVASYSCEFIENNFASYGIWQAKNPFSGDCVDYVGDAPDQVKAARGMAVLTTIFGFILMIVGCAAVCMPFPAKMFKCFGVAYFFTTLFEGLKFVFVIDSDKQLWMNYSLDYGASCGIAATCLWFVSMLMSCAVKPPEDDDSSPKEVEESAKEEEPKNEENENTEEEPKNEEEAKPDEEA